ncbi:hypothetical protein PENSPDRAFT_740575 [Peniophora sp. CONT]|nr:hypothetical protein PENSPDRAFT_740575 [Peniophora sp. CONT]
MCSPLLGATRIESLLLQMLWRHGSARASTSRRVDSVVGLMGSGAGADENTSEGCDGFRVRLSRAERCLSRGFLTDDLGSNAGLSFKCSIRTLGSTLPDVQHRLLLLPSKRPSWTTDFFVWRERSRWCYEGGDGYGKWADLSWRRMNDEDPIDERTALKEQYCAKYRDIRVSTTLQHAAAYLLISESSLRDLAEILVNRAAASATPHRPPPSTYNLAYYPIVTQSSVSTSAIPQHDQTRMAASGGAGGKWEEADGSLRRATVDVRTLESLHTRDSRFSGSHMYGARF